MPLFPGLPRRVEIDAAAVHGVIDELEERWPGVRDRLCEPGPALRMHIHVYVDRVRASLDTPLARGLARRRRRRDQRRLAAAAEDRQEEEEDVEDVEEDRRGKQRRDPDVLRLPQPLEVDHREAGEDDQAEHRVDQRAVRDPHEDGHDPEDDQREQRPEEIRASGCRSRRVA